MPSEEQMRKRFMQATIESLPFDDPMKATTLMLTTSAVVVASCGFDDDQALRGFKAALQECRARGVGEEHH